MRCMLLDAHIDDIDNVWESLSNMATLDTKTRVGIYISNKLEQQQGLPLDSRDGSVPKRVKKQWWNYLKLLNDLQKESENIIQNSSVFSLSVNIM